MPNCTTPDIARLVERFAKLVIIGDEMKWDIASTIEYLIG